MHYATAYFEKPLDFLAKRTEAHIVPYLYVPKFKFKTHSKNTNYFEITTAEKVDGHTYIGVEIFWI